MGVTDHLTTDESAPESDHSDPTTNERGQRGQAADPFSFGYRTDLYEVDQETVDQGLSVFIALSNLL